MKTEQIIELAKKAARETQSDYTDSEPDENATAGLLKFTELYREALIASGELVPREKVNQIIDGFYNRHPYGKPINEHNKLINAIKEAIDRARSQP